MKQYTFTAKLVKNDARTGWKKGRTFDPLGFYYNGKNIILVGSVSCKNAVRMSFPVDSVEMTVKESGFILVCEDASHLGGPMGSEYTEHVFSKVFPSSMEAQEYAVKYQDKKHWPEWAEWNMQSNGSLTCDSGRYIWTISRA